MQLEPIIAALRARCPSFANRVAGAAQFKLLPENASLAVPCAYVVPLDDNPQESISQNSVRQALKDSFAVIVALSNLADERGQSGAHSVDSLRGELWAGLIGWRPVPLGVDTSQSRYDGIQYEGGSLLALDRARLWYQFEFGALMEIEPSDGWQNIELGNLSPFDGADVKVDVVAPIADPNLKYPGPDGRVEQEFSVPQGLPAGTTLQG